MGHFNFSPKKFFKNQVSNWKTRSHTCLSGLLISFTHFPFGEILGGLAGNAMWHLASHLSLTRKPFKAYDHDIALWGLIIDHHWPGSRRCMAQFQVLDAQKRTCWGLVPTRWRCGFLHPWNYIHCALWCMCAIAHLKMQALTYSGTPLNQHLRRAGTSITGSWASLFWLPLT